MVPSLLLNILDVLVRIFNKQDSGMAVNSIFSHSLVLYMHICNANSFLLDNSKDSSVWG